MPELILASASAARARLLRSAGVPATVEVPRIDEAVIKRRCRAEGLAASDCAAALAEAKARAVGPLHRDAWVIGADQMLVFSAAWFDKPADRDQAGSQLMALRGKSHELPTAVCVVCDNNVLWRMLSVPRLTMRPFSDAFLDSYLAAEGEAVLGSVGAYRLEGLGAQLFDLVEGDHFAIQGLPLLELLAFLREHGAITV